jgi:hypothetical protein
MLGLLLGLFVLPAKVLGQEKGKYNARYKTGLADSNRPISKVNHKKGVKPELDGPSFKTAYAALQSKGEAVFLA